jgi:hypothetical protein
MSDVTLKAVFTINPQTTAFAPAGHNLAPEKAVERTSELESEGKKVQTVDQPSRHKALSFKHCKACTAAAENLSQQRPPDPAEEESEVDEAT